MTRECPGALKHHGDEMFVCQACIDDAVDEWHKIGPTMLPMSAFLGLSHAEYATWVETCKLPGHAQGGSPALANPAYKISSGMPMENFQEGVVNDPVILPRDHDTFAGDDNEPPWLVLPGETIGLVPADNGEPPDHPDRAYVAAFGRASGRMYAPWSEWVACARRIIAYEEWREDEEAARALLRNGSGVTP